MIEYCIHDHPCRRSLIHSELFEDHDPSLSYVSYDVACLPFLVYMMQCLGGMFPHGLILSFSSCFLPAGVWYGEFGKSVPCSRGCNSSSRNSLQIILKLRLGSSGVSAYLYQIYVIDMSWKPALILQLVLAFVRVPVMQLGSMR